MARFTLAELERQAGNHNRAFQHYIICSKAGMKMSLDVVKLGYAEGMVTKEEFGNSLRAYKKAQDELKNDVRDKAAAHIQAFGRLQ